MKAIVCKECGFSIENIEPGFHFCPQCQKEVKFLKFEAFCGSKPGELYERS